MTAPTTTTRAGRVPPGLAEILAKVDAYEGDELLDRYAVAELLDVKPDTVTSWATKNELSGLLLSKRIGWRFTKIDLKRFLTARYYTAR